MMKRENGTQPILIRGGTIVTDSATFTADLWIEDGVIQKIGKDLSVTNYVKVINAKEKFILPGLIDPHVHFQLPFCGTVSKDSFSTGSQAAALGGVTTFIDFATQVKGQTLQEAIAQRREEADGNVCVDYSLHAVITDWNPRTQKEIKQIIRQGIPSFKMYMIYRQEGWMASDADLLFALQETRRWGGIVEVHAENIDIIEGLIEKIRSSSTWMKRGAYAHFLTRPAFTEAEAIQRAISLAEYAQAALYIVHISSKEGLETLRKGRERGVKVFGETCPHYLLLDASLLKNSNNGHLFATCPPIRTGVDREALWRGLRDGAITCMGTDTCTFDTAQKAMWRGDFTKIPFGMPGIETFLPLMYTEGFQKSKLTLPQLVKITSTNAAKLFGLYPKKGTIQVEADADLVIIDPQEKRIINWKNLRTNCDWSPYQGRETYGWPTITILRGQILVENGKFVGNPNGGRFVPGKPFTL